MSDRVTWGKCPKCGALAAVGWTTVTGAPGESADEEPSEIDCMSGCHLGAEALRQLADRMN